MYPNFCPILVPNTKVEAEDNPVLSPPLMPKSASVEIPSAEPEIPVKFAPLIAGSVPVKFAAGKLVSDAPEPLKVAAVTVPPAVRLVLTPTVTAFKFNV